MKKFVFALFFICCAVYAFAAPVPYAHLITYPDMGMPFFRHIINGDTATYSICISKDVTATYNERKVEDIFLYSVNQWFDTTKDFINFTYGGRKKFKDILNILEHRGPIRKVDCSFYDQDQINKQGSDLVILITNDISKHCGSDALSCYNTEDNILFFPENMDTSLDNILFGKQRLYNYIVTHELGHAFGLADKYEGAISYSSFIYNSGVKRPSVMAVSKFITCDDVDGFITSIDRITHTKRTFKSFCKDGIVIDNGKSIAFVEGEKYTVKEFYKDFDIEIVSTYEKDAKTDDGYFIDMTLDNFDKSENALSVLRYMGFDISDEVLLSKYKVKIHAYIKERDYHKEHSTQIHRMPQGLTSSILLLDGKEEQVIAWELFSEHNFPVRTIIEQNKVEELDRKIMLPIINYFPPRIRVQDNLLKETEAKINRFSEKSVKSALNNDIKNH